MRLEEEPEDLRNGAYQEVEEFVRLCKPVNVRNRRLKISCRQPESVLRLRS